MQLLIPVIFTNPDTLHITIMPNEEKWRSFLKNLKYVVVDGCILNRLQLMHLELHVYTGLFGSHVAFVMRRLRRLCAAVGNRRHLQFISCTATLPNAKQVFVVPYMSNEGSTWRQYLDWTV
jgi:DEAD/DEAH box helicase domain-containing protein